MKVLILLSVTVLYCQAVSYFDLVQEQWHTFKAEHDKEYGSETEERFRLRIFMDNSLKVAKHNQLYQQGLVSYKLGVNQFADLLHHEYVATLNGINNTENIIFSDMEDSITFIPPANVELPVSVDWRKKGAVTPIKDQGHCGSCWSFSTTGALEGQHFKKTGNLVSLSEQNLIDCDTISKGCNGGWMNTAFKYIKENGGIDTEESYPYRAKDGKCHYNPDNSGATDMGFVCIESGNEEELKAAVATVGPISIAIDASLRSFQFYSDGVYHDSRCSSTKINHAVLVVGYGTDERSGLDYWLVKNSWGHTWGNQGYVKLARNKGNQCAVATYASYPIV